MTPAQLATLKAYILADPVLAPLTSGPGTDFNTVMLTLNAAVAPAYVVWRTNVTGAEIGDAWNGNDIDGMSSLNMQRLQLLFASAPNGVFNMSRADRRAGFEGPFGANANGPSRVAMRASWKRSANVVEKLFATGTGTDADPALTTFEGSVSVQQIAGMF